MNGQQVLNRLRAHHSGKPLPQYDTIHFPIAKNHDLLILSFLRMGGESAPWGLAVGHPGKKPTLLTVPEGRNRDLVADMAAKLAPVLLEHFYHPSSSDLAQRDDLDALPLRQLWLPNASHLEMLHHLAYSYTFTKWVEQERAKTLNRLGRLTGWLFRESQRPGQLTVMVTTEALKNSYVFPAQDIRQSHLGFLLAWLRTSGGREKRAAAAADAEQLSIATTLDPSIERDSLEKEVERYNHAVKVGESGKAKTAEDKIRRSLEAELLRRFTLTEQAVEVLRADKRQQNTGVTTLVKVSRDRFWFDYLRREAERQVRGDANVYTPSPETDRNPRAAAAQYYLSQASEEVRASVLLHDDPALQNEAIAAGEAFRGKIISVKNESSSRALKPVWRISSDIGTTRLRAGSRLCVSRLPSRQVRVRRLDSDPKGSIVLEVEVTALKTVPRPQGKVLHSTDPSLVGTSVTLLPMAVEGIGLRKSQKVWAKGTPGSWLTAAIPGGLRAALPPEVSDNVRAAADQ